MTAGRLWMFGVVILTVGLAFARGTASLTLSNAGSQGVGSDNSQKADEPARKEEPDRVVPPLPIYEVNPEFPESKQRKTSHGEILLRATIAPDGTVKDVSIISGEPVLASSAANAVRKWRYLPAMKSGIFVEGTEDVSIKYRLGKTVAKPEEPGSGLPRMPEEDLLDAISAGKVFRTTGTGMVLPKAIESPDPEYSEVARVNKFQGSLELGVVVATDGKPQSVWVVRPLGHGLDEQAIRSVRQWKFSPATKNGGPVPFVLNVEVSFALSDGYEPEFEFDAVR